MDRQTDRLASRPRYYTARQSLKICWGEAYQTYAFLKLHINQLYFTLDRGKWVEPGKLRWCQTPIISVEFELWFSQLNLTRNCSNRRRQTMDFTVWGSEPSHMVKCHENAYSPKNLSFFASNIEDYWGQIKKKWKEIKSPMFFLCLCTSENVLFF